MYNVETFTFVKPSARFFDWHAIFAKNGVLGFSVWGNRKKNYILSKVQNFPDDLAAAEYFYELKAGKLENGYVLNTGPWMQSKPIESFDDLCNYMKNRYNSDSVVTTLWQMQEPKQITKPNPVYDLAALSHYGTW